MKLITAQPSVSTGTCNAKMLPGGVRKIGGDLPKQATGCFPQRGESSGHGTDRYPAVPVEY